MERPLTRYYKKEKNRITEKCKACGICAKKCPIIKHTDLANVSPPEIQKQIKTYLKTGEINETIFTRAFACMECFKCVDKCCPEGLNPLLVNETIKWEYCNNQIVETLYGDPRSADSAQRVVASIQLAAEDYQKLTTPTDSDRARLVFFAGCNIYFQPEKILSALELTALITEDCAFVPGLDFCCGSGFAGSPVGAKEFIALVVICATGCMIAATASLAAAIKPDAEVMFFPISAHLADDGYRWMVPAHGCIYERKEDSIWRKLAAFELENF